MDTQDSSDLEQPKRRRRLAGSNCRQAKVCKIDALNVDHRADAASSAVTVMMIEKVHAQGVSALAWTVV